MQAIHFKGSFDTGCSAPLFWIDWNTNSLHIGSLYNLPGCPDKLTFPSFNQGMWSEEIEARVTKTTIIGKNFVKDGSMTKNLEKRVSKCGVVIRMVIVSDKTSVDQCQS